MFSTDVSKLTFQECDSLFRFLTVQKLQNAGRVEYIARIDKKLKEVGNQITVLRRAQMEKAG